MEIDNALIAKLAGLSKLHFNDIEKESLKIDLQNMLHFVNTLNELDTAGVEPLLHISNNAHQFREDEVSNSYTKTDALKNAKLKDEHFFKVPKVIQK